MPRLVQIMAIGLGFGQMGCRVEVRAGRVVRLRVAERGAMRSGETKSHPSGWLTRIIWHLASFPLVAV